MRLDIVTIFPEFFASLGVSLVGKAIQNGIVDLRIHDLRQFTHDRHHSVDDTPFGGGPGMVMKPEPWGEALDAILGTGPAPADPAQLKLIIPTPNGQVFDQRRAQALAESQWLIIACGRYEGIDGRVADHFRDRVEVAELSIGDYVLAGGEAAALVMAEATIRLLPGVLGNPQSAGDDSFATDRSGAPLEGPVYTKPARWRGLPVPEVLLSGNHGAIAQWRAAQAITRTRTYRPDL